MNHHLVITSALFALSLWAYLPSNTVNKPVHVEPIVIVEPDVEPIKTAIIEMQLADWCGPCRKFKASGAIAELKKKGWKIEYTDGIAKSYPSFRVWVDGKSSTFSGYSSKNSFFRILKKHMADLKD